MKNIIVFLFVCIVFLFSVTVEAKADLIATFYEFSEGFVGDNITTEGITIHNLDDYTSTDDQLYIEEADTASLSTTYLTTFGYTPGTGYGFGRFGSADIAFDLENATSINIDILHFTWNYLYWKSNSLTLEAYLNGTLVGQNTILFDFDSPSLETMRQTLSITGVPFDDLRLFASGPTNIGEVFIGIDNITIAVAPVEVSIDIKPYDSLNSINPGNKGKITVAVLTTDTFDAVSVDEYTVLFGATGIEAESVHSAEEDVDEDGDIDLVLHFRTQDTDIICSDTSAFLTGETFDGQIIEGTDSIKTVGCIKKI